MQKAIRDFSSSGGVSYKEIPLPGVDNGEALARIAASINVSGNPHWDLILEQKKSGGSHPVLYLHSVDMTALREYLQTLVKEPSDEVLVDGILNAIENVRSYGVRGGRRVYAGYNAERKVAGRKDKEKARGKYFYAAGGDYNETRNQYPCEYENKIICRDSGEFLKNLPDNCVDLVFTSPPYNFGLDYAADEDDATDWSAYFDRLFSVLDECIRVLVFGGRLIINVQPLYSDYIPSHHIISNYLANEKKLIWKSEILWEKNNYNCKYTAWGSWKSPSNPYMKYSWEFLEVFCKGSLKKPGEKDNADISGDDFKQWVYAKWSIAPERNMTRYGHPAMFPEELAHRVLTLFSFKDDMVLDPFNGAGTTCVAAKKTGRRYLGIDVSKEYCVVSEQRLAELLDL